MYIMNSRILRSDNYGLTFTVNTNDNIIINYSHVACSADGKYVYIKSSSYAFIYISNDYGLTFTTVNKYNNGTLMAQIDSPKIICSSSGQNIWIHDVMWYVSTTVISYSSDYGISWSQNSTPLTSTSNIAVSEDGKYIYISKYLVGLYYSSDYGVTWTLNNNIPGGTFNEIQCSRDGKIVYAAFNWVTIYKSINYGKTFIAFTQPIELLKLLKSGILLTWYSNNLYREAVVNTIYNGYIDEFNILDKKLTVDEVNILYNNNNNIANFNYSNHLPTGTYNGNIIPRKLTPVWSIVTRNYNATTKFDYTYTLNNKIADDILDISNIIIYNYLDANLGLSKLSNFSNIALIGDNYFNYDICSNSIAYGTVNRAELVPKLNIDKTYDKTTLAIVNNSQLLVRNLIGTSVENILVGAGSDLFFNVNNSIYWYKSSNITSIFTSVNSVLWNEEMWLAVGAGTGTMAYSINGVDWFSLGNSIFSTAGYSVAWSKQNRIWVAVGTGNNSIASSYDGLVWTGYGTSLLSEGRDVYYANNMFIAVGASAICYSVDGLTWSSASVNISSLMLNKTSYINSTKQWIAYSEYDTSGNIYTSIGGINWSQININAFNNFNLYNIHSLPDKSIINYKVNKKLLEITISGAIMYETISYNIYIFTNKTGSINITNYEFPVNMYAFVVGGGGDGSSNFGGLGGSIIQSSFLLTNNDNINITVGNSSENTSVIFTNNTINNIISNGGSYGSLNTYYSNLINLINTKSPWGIYCAESYSNNILYELRNNGRNATTNNVSFGYNSGNGALSIPYIYGTTGSTIVWPSGSVPSTFTLCTITRYTGGANGRIINSTDNVFLHGHWNNNRGVIYNDGWRTNNTPSIGIITNWLVTCYKNIGDIPNNILIDGIPSGIVAGGNGF